MKRSIISAAVLSVVFMSAGAFAADTDQGELIITGKVVGTTCKFTGDSTATIGMNQIGADRLNALSAGGVYDGYTNKTTVPLTVECTGLKHRKLLFPVLNSIARINTLHEILPRITVLVLQSIMVMNRLILSLVFS